MLFCDVRGSTSMAEGLDPEDWTDVMNAAYEHLIAPVYRHEGTVARLMGDAILAFFGAPTAHEDDPQRAVMAGLEIVASIVPFRESLARERGLDLHVRVGINTGPVVVGDVGSELRREYSAMGDAVNVAARMEQTAEPGTVRITEDTYRLVADLFDVEPLGEVDVKGNRLPVSSYRVLGRRSVTWKVRATRSLDAPLVGRETEMAAVRSAIDDLRRGRGSILLITGDPGLGKSRLVEEANARWSEHQPDDDHPWDFWQCVPYDTMQPYAQYRRLIRERAGVTETDPADRVRAKIADVMTTAPQGWEARSERVARALLGVEPPDEPHLEGEAFQREATELVVGSTVALGGGRLVVFEDLHWCDHASLDLVRATTEVVGEMPILILITMRPDRGAPSWDLKGWISDELRDHSVLLELEQLTHDQSGRLIEELLPVEGMPEVVRARILARTEGNPLFVHEVARDLIDRGLVRDDEDGRRVVGEIADVTIPDSVQSLITVGLDRLPHGARQTLQAAAVIGRTFDQELLEAVAGGSDLGSDLLELEQRDLIRPTAGKLRVEYTFRHALTQEAAYGTLLLKDRRALHGRVVRALEAAAPDRLDEVAALLVRHSSEAGDDEATLKYAVAAGDAAARLYANAEAAAHYRIGLDVGRAAGAEPAVLRGIYERRGNALELLGLYDDAIANYEEMLADARTRGDEATELAANTAIALLYATPTPKFDPERGRRMSEENVTMARRLGDRAAEARALWNIVVANVYGGGDAARAVEAGEASLPIARELGDREQLAYTLNDVSRAHMATGEFATASRRLEEARGIWEELDNRPMLGENLTVGSALHAFGGDYPAALADARRAFSISESIENAWGQSHALITIYRVELELGAFGDAMLSMERCRELGERGGFAFAGIATRADLSRAVAYLGDGERALALAEEALTIARERVPPAASIAHVARASALITAGDHGGALDALDEADPTKLPEPDRTFLLVASRLARARVALRTGDPEEAEAIAREVIRHLRSNGVQILVAEALVALGRALIASERLEEAERELTDALASADRLGERKTLWEALARSADLAIRRGAEEDAAGLRRRARGIIEEIAAGISDESLRGRFLARDDVRALVSRGPGR
jgi:class 3 adenylate cyclase/tetratricopeptide (TPR) repeat protein